MREKSSDRRVCSLRKEWDRQVRSGQSTEITALAVNPFENVGGKGGKRHEAAKGGRLSRWLLFIYLFIY